jgi:signal transduction histidine kinase/DNA-binding response OmpR family regulator
MVNGEAVFTPDISLFLGGNCVLELHKDGVMVPVFLSDSFCRMLGSTRDILLGKSARDAMVLVYEQDREKCLQDFLSGFAQGGGFTSVFRFIPPHDDPMWVSANCNAVVEDGHHYVYISFNLIGEELTEQRAALERLEDETMQRSSLESNTLGKVYFELEKDCIIEAGISQFCGEAQVLPQTYSGILPILAATAIDGRQRERFMEELNIDHLRCLLDSGKTTAQVETLRTLQSGRRIWTRTVVRMMPHPSKGNTVALLFTYDIDDEKTNQLVVDAVMNRTYDFIMNVNIQSNRYRLFSNALAEAVHFASEGDYLGAGMLMIIRRYILDEDWHKAQTCGSLREIQEQLRQQDVYEFSLRFRRADGMVRTKKIECRYLDEQCSLILITQLDITEVVREEQNQRNLMESAMIAAKQANSAKSNFLSRMSHEIRTPMNAIIGMSTIAAQSIGQDEKIADCIAKIGISARYLLSLINDILDMSRIESGRMLLKTESFSFKEFINGISAIIYNQVEKKGLDYECLISNEIEDAYIGDAMKLQQVLINILGNAVKYTDKGKISFEIQQISRHGDQAMLRFIINDTGRGISDSFLERIFDPFEQEDTTSTAVFAGTGLGLAISKNLVELMSGKIKVRSILGIGSEFTVDIPLTVDEDITINQPQLAYHFEDLLTLVVDDDAMVCEQTIKTLRDIGMVGEWVTTGQAAVSRVQDQFAKSIFYDFIIIDWKMPEMDGIETARQIRRVVGPDVTIIIMTAYDWSMIESDAKAAGVNLLISKPLFKSTLISTFQKAKGQGGEHEAKKEFDFDFTGKRVLVAEDNQLNAEIATCLLERQNFQTEVAPNGQKALEMFASHPVGYYDAILMDIRMPIMDGLQTTINIRHWQRDDAKSMVIIAMTANAFDEDVEKSKAAGMNAHLAKPIDPDLMYRTLYRLLYQKNS